LEKQITQTTIKTNTVLLQFELHIGDHCENLRELDDPQVKNTGLALANVSGFKYVCEMSTSTGVLQKSK
jgi:hypothetical protein